MTSRSSMYVLGTYTWYVGQFYVHHIYHILYKLYKLYYSLLLCGVVVVRNQKHALCVVRVRTGKGPRSPPTA